MDKGGITIKCGKLIGVSIACYNERDNIRSIVEKIGEIFNKELPEYDYMIQFIDNASNDGTQNIIREVCKENPNVCAIFNARNFGGQSGYYGLINARGDCVIAIPCDFQVPIELIPKFVKEWENGAKIVCAIKTSSKENYFMWNMRKLYYLLAKRFSQDNIITNFTGSGLYDKSFLDICRSIDDPVVSFMEMVSSLGYDIANVEFEQEMRKAGKTKNNLWSLIDLGISRFVNVSKIGPRMATLIGFFVGILSAIISVVFFILKLIYWDRFAAGVASIIVGIFFVSAVQLFFIGLIGEYIINVNTRLMKRPIVVERERINFDKGGEGSKVEIC